MTQDFAGTHGDGTPEPHAGASSSLAGGSGLAVVGRLAVEVERLMDRDAVVSRRFRDVERELARTLDRVADLERGDHVPSRRGPRR